MTVAHAHRTRPTATLTASAAGLVAIFTVLAVSVRERSGVTSIDPRITAVVVDHRSGLLTHAARTLTFLGSEPVVGVLAVVLIVVLLERRGPVHAWIAAATMGTSAFLTVTVKLAFGRPRPGASDRLGPPDSTFSFPSGHTLSSAVLLGLFCVLLLPVVRPAARRVALAASTVVGLGIGASRVYLGYHWTTDVIASWTIAALLLLVTHAACSALVPGRRSGGSQVPGASIDP